jgi:hypothetical protein
MTGPSYYDDNFGHYEIESEEDVEFYFSVQAQSMEKTCEGCGRRVKLMPQYGYCNECAAKRERGWDI